MKIFDGTTLGCTPSIETIAGVEIPVIKVGEYGRGRKLGILPVDPVTIDPDGIIRRGEIGQTKAGKPKLILEKNDDGNALVILRTHIGYRGSNSHTGDRTHGINMEEYLPWPGDDIITGIIAQGDAGNMGSGEQKISIFKPRTIWRTAYSGKLYGDPKYHYWAYDGNFIMKITGTERDISDLF
jgi:hypothetical protein